MDKLIIVDANVVSHGRCVATMADVAIPRNLLADISKLIAELQEGILCATSFLWTTSLEPDR
jgi:hypothetical protein